MHNSGCLAHSLQSERLSAASFREKRVSPLFTMVAPLVLSVAVGVFAWLILSAESEVDSTAPPKACGTCGSSVRDNWRLCPECGSFIKGADPGDDTPSMRAHDSDSDSALPF
jgi:hypothetical protein